jgi:hypothetical protein
MNTEKLCNPLVKKFARNTLLHRMCAVRCQVYTVLTKMFTQNNNISNNVTVCYMFRLQLTIIRWTFQYMDMT